MFTTQMAYMYTLILSSVTTKRSEVNKKANPKRKFSPDDFGSSAPLVRTPVHSSSGGALVLHGNDRTGSVENVIGECGHQPSIG